MATSFSDSNPHTGWEKANGGWRASPRRGPASCCTPAAAAVAALVCVWRLHVPTLQLGLFPEVVKALKAARVLECQLVAKVPEEEGHEDDEESDGSQKAQHLWRDWDRADLGYRKLFALLQLSKNIYT